MPTPIELMGVRAVVYNVTGYAAAMGQIRREAALTAGTLVGLGRASDASLNQLQTLGAQVGNVGNAIRTIGNQVSNLGLRMGLFLTLPTVAAGAAIVATGTRFEDNLVKIETLGGVAREQVQAWSDELLELAPQLATLPNELAEGLYFVTSTGFRDAKGAIDTLVVSAKGAAVGLGETEVVANSITAAMSVFGLTAEDSGDKLIATVREGKVEADELVRTIGRVLAVGQEAGLTFDEIAAFVATYTRTGVTAEVATTALRAALSAIIKPTAQSKAALEEYGLTVDDVRAAIEERGYANVLLGLAALFGENDEAMAKLIGTQRGLAGVLSVTGELQDDYLAILEEIKNSHGELDTAFARTAQTTTFQWHRLVATLNVVAQEIAAVVLPALNSILSALVPVVQAISDLARVRPELVTIAVLFAVVAAAVGPALFIVGQLIVTFGALIVVVGNVISVLGLLLTPLGLIVAPILAVIAVLTAMGAAVALNIRGIAEKMDTDFTALAGRAATWGKNIIVSLANGIIRGAAAVIRALTYIANIIASALRAHSPPRILPELPAWGQAAAQSWLDGWLEADFSVFNDIADTVAQFISALGAARGSEQSSILESIIEARSELGAIINEWRELGSVSQEALDALADNLGENAQAVIGYVQSMLDLAEATAAVEAAQEHLNEVQEHYAALLDPLQSRLKAINAEQERTRREDRRRQLERILVDPRATAEVKRRARLELEELRILDQIARIETERDAAVDEAQSELDSAEALLEAAQNRVDLQKQFVELVREELNLTGQLKAAIEAATAAAASAGAGGGGGETPELGGGGIPPIDGGGAEGADPNAPHGGRIPGNLGAFQHGLERLEQEVQGQSFIERFLGDIGAGIDDAVKELEAALPAFQEAWADIFDAMADPDVDFSHFAGALVGALVKATIDLVKEEGPKIVQSIFDEMFGGGLTDFVSGTGAFANFDAALSQAIFGYDDPMVWAQTEIPLWFAEIKRVFFEEMLSIFRGERFLDDVNLEGTPFDTFFDNLQILFTTNTPKVNKAWDDMNEDINLSTDEIVRLVLQYFSDMFNDLVGNSIVPDGVSDILSEFDRLTELATKAKNALDEAERKFLLFVNSVVGPSGIIPSFVGNVVRYFTEDLPQGISGALAAITEEGSAIFTQALTLGENIMQKIVDGLSSINFLGILIGIISRAFNQASTFIDNWVGSLGGDGDGAGGAPGNTGFIGGAPGGGFLGGVLSRGNVMGNQTLVAAPTVVTAGPGGTAVNVTVNATIHNDMDAKSLGATIRKEVNKAISGR